MNKIKWLKMGYPGLDMGATYEVEKGLTGDLAGFIQITDEWGRQIMLHKRYLGVLFVEAI